MPTKAALVDDELLTVRQVAERLQVTPQTVRNLTIKHGLRFTRIAREIRFKRIWIEEYIDSGGREIR